MPPPLFSDMPALALNASGQWSALGHVGLAALLAGLLGLEREWRGKPAGLRTHLLVGAAAATIIVISELLIDYFSLNVSMASVRTDPIRVVQAVVIGISFLGAGTIVIDRKEGSVEGLTTAASILLASAIGMTAALQAYILAVGVTVASLLVLGGVARVEKFFLHARSKDADEEKGPD